MEQQTLPPLSSSQKLGIMFDLAASGAGLAALGAVAPRVQDYVATAVGTPDAIVIAGLCIGVMSLPVVALTDRTCSGSYMAAFNKALTGHLEVMTAAAAMGAMVLQRCFS